MTCRLTAAVLLAALFCSCAAPAGHVKHGRSAAEKPAGPGAAVVFARQTFKLSKTPDPGVDAGMQNALDAAFETAVKNHSGEKPMEIGFTYSVAPKGAVYPFSEIEVSCIMQEKYRGKGARLCSDFFGELEPRFKKLSGGAK